MSKEVPFRRYALLWSEICRRTCQPFKRPSFPIFVILAIIAAGGIGVWWEVIRFFYNSERPDTAAIRTAIITVSPAIAGPAVLQLIYARAEKEFLSAAIFVCLVIAVLLIICLAPATSPAMSIILGSISWIVSIWLWIVANADEPVFNTPDDAASLGGDPTAPLAGSLNQYKH